MTVEVLFPGQSRTFTYSVPEKHSKKPLLYCRVYCKLRDQKLKGIVISVTASGISIPQKLNQILKVIDSSPVFSYSQLQLAERLSQYYNCRLSDAVFQMIPAASRQIESAPDHTNIDSIDLTALNQHQKKVVDSIMRSASEKSDSKVATHLLFGVTGSGKTRVYIELACKFIETGEKVIYLVPEISLAWKFWPEFQKIFKDRCAFLHSGLKSSQRILAQKKILSGNIDFVLGTRSAVFSPFKNTGLIIIDEEHDSSYKENSGFYYSAKRVAWMKLSLHDNTGNTLNPTLVLGSATPALESYYLARNGSFYLHELRQKAVAGVPPVKFFIPEYDFSQGPISPFLKDKIREHLSRGRQILLLLNRRGHSTVVLCETCDAIPECPHCMVSLTYHNDNTLQCHYCSYREPYSGQCHSCGGKRKLSGTGTQKVEEILEKMFPNVPYGRFDRDSTSNREQLVALVEAAEKQDIKILIGTQMIAKGFDLPKLTLVGIINGDTGLGMPDFRASERVFQLLSQAAGRTGRHEPGEVVLQSMQPEHPAVRLAIEGKYTEFAQRELELRKEIGYPPFIRLARVVVESQNEQLAYETLEKIVQFIQADTSGDIFSTGAEEDENAEILGPTPAPLAKLKDKFRFHILIKSKSFSVLARTVSKCHVYTRKHSNDSIRIEVDIDPMDIL